MAGSTVAPPDMSEGAALMLAAERGAARSIRGWQLRGGDINLPLAHGGAVMTPLQTAAHAGYTLAVKTLLECGADADRTAGRGSDHEGHSPLQLAARCGHTDAVLALLQAGANPGARDAFGQTPLHYGAAFGHADCCVALLRYGCDPAVLDASGHAAAALAEAAGHAQLSGVSVCRVGGQARRHPALSIPPTPPAALIAVLLREACAAAAAAPAPSASALAAAASAPHAPLRHPSPLARTAAALDRRPLPQPPVAASGRVHRSPSPPPDSRSRSAARLEASPLPAAPAPGSPLGPLPPLAGRILLREWLRSLDMAQFFSGFVTAGFDDVAFVSSLGGLSDADCDAVGIPAAARGHRRKVQTLYGIGPFLHALHAPQKAPRGRRQGSRSSSGSSAGSGGSGSESRGSDTGSTSSGSSSGSTSSSGSRSSGSSPEAHADESSSWVSRTGGGSLRSRRSSGSSGGESSTSEASRPSRK